jgi:flagellar protein FlbD
MKQGCSLNPMKKNDFDDRIDSIRKELEVDFAKPIPNEVINKCIPGIPVRRKSVITLTKLNGTSFILNPELIETIESTPDTIIAVVTGRKYIVKESVEDVRNLYMNYKRDVLSTSP